MDNFRLIYRILRFLEASTKQAEFDEDNFTAEHFGVEDDHFKNALEILYKRKLFSEMVVRRGADGYVSISGGDPQITLEGLEYLHGNEFMLKEAERAKGHS